MFRFPVAAWAAVAGIVGGQCHAQTSVALSGTVDVGVRHVKNGRLGSIDSEVSGANTTSKLVVQVREALGDGLSAGIYLDSTLLGDTGAVNTPFWDRRATVSLAHDRLGEIRLGRDWAPTHILWSDMDPFITLGIAGANSFRSVFASRALGQAFGVSADANQLNPTLRIANTAQYFLPTGLGGLYGSLLVSAGEGGAAGAGSAKTDGGRLAWRGEQLMVGLAQVTTRNANAGRDFTDRVWGASYDFKVLKVSLGQRQWRYGTDKTTNTLVAALVPLGFGDLKFSVLRADQKGATAAQSSNDATLIGAGYVHHLSKRTAVYAHASRIANKGGASFAVTGGPVVSGVATAANYFGGQKSTAFESGIRHNF
jgi:predicted porin